MVFNSEGNAVSLNYGRRGGDRPARSPFGLAALAFASAALMAGGSGPAGAAGQPRVVYGPDNRVEVFNLAGPRATNANATVALVPSGGIVDNGNGTSRLVSPTLGTALNLCPGQRFRPQPTAAFCSGFLARPNRVVTAGHCVSPGTLAGTRFVFGYRMRTATQARTTIPNADIYRGVQLVVDRLQGDEDFAVVRLDRNVTGRVPAPIQAANAVALNTPLYVIGHPSGLPAKLAAGAKVFGNASPFFLSANLDTFGGNSGSPVFNANTNRVVGILVRGAPDYRPQGGCNVVNILPNTIGEEESTRISLVTPFLGPPAPAASAPPSAALQR